jgi:tRNA (guanine37-N1)-methyltransferase
VENDSFYNESVFDHPHFTRPFEWQGYKVPQVLANGNHAHINLFRHRCALSKTARIRPDLVSWNRVKTEFEDEKVKKARIRRLNKLGLIKKYDFNKDAPDNKNIDNKDAADNKNIDKKCGNKNSHEKNKPEKIEFTSRNLFLGLVHCPVLNKFKGVSTSSVTNFDIHDISRSARTFGVKNYFLIIPQKNQRDLVEKIRDFWLDPDKKIPHKKRCEALERIEVLPNLNSVIQEIFHLTGKKPLIAVTSASESEGIDILDYNMAVEKSIVSERPLLILLGTAYGLAPEIIRLADFSLPPVMGFDQWNHLSVRAAGAIILSRLNEAYNHRTYNQRIYNQRTYNQRTCNQGI